jgi:hypothetical protein
MRFAYCTDYVVSSEFQNRIRKQASKLAFATSNGNVHLCVSCHARADGRIVLNLQFNPVEEYEDDHPLSVIGSNVQLLVTRSKALRSATAHRVWPPINHSTVMNVLCTLLDITNAITDHPCSWTV